MGLLETDLTWMHAWRFRIGSNRFPSLDSAMKGYLEFIRRESTPPVNWLIDRLRESYYSNNWFWNLRVCFWQPIICTCFSQYSKYLLFLQWKMILDRKHTKRVSGPLRMQPISINPWSHTITDREITKTVLDAKRTYRGVQAIYMPWAQHSAVHRLCCKRSD